MNDYAGVMREKHKSYIRAKLADLDKRTGIEATVLTIESIYDYDTGDETIESFATNLFNSWGIGNREKDDGLLILIAVRDHQVRIEVGTGYGSSLDQPMQRVIDEKMVPHFRQENYSTGIYEGTLAAIKEVTGDARLGETTRIPIDSALLELLFVILCIGLAVGITWLAAKLAVRQFPSKRRRKRGRRSRRGRYLDDVGSYSGGSSSSDGAGGFGGGSSSGGGASGDW